LRQARGLLVQGRQLPSFLREVLRQDEVPDGWIVAGHPVFKQLLKKNIWEEANKDSAADCTDLAG
jgi:hypothetical protein